MGRRILRGRSERRGRLAILICVGLLAASLYAAWIAIAERGGTPAPEGARESESATEPSLVGLRGGASNPPTLPVVTAPVPPEADVELVGEVLTAQRSPAQGATVFARVVPILDARGSRAAQVIATTETAADGSWSLRIPNSYREVFLQAHAGQGLRSQQELVGMSVGQAPRRVRMVLSHTVRLDVRITAADGSTPLAGARVYAASSRVVDAAPDTDARTDDAGRCTLQVAPGGVTVRVELPDGICFGRYLSISEDGAPPLHLRAPSGVLWWRLHLVGAPAGSGALIVELTSGGSAANTLVHSVIVSPQEPVVRVPVILGGDVSAVLRTADATTSRYSWSRPTHDSTSGLLSMPWPAHTRARLVLVDADRHQPLSHFAYTIASSQDGRLSVTGVADESGADEVWLPGGRLELRVGSRTVVPLPEPASAAGPAILVHVPGHGVVAGSCDCRDAPRLDVVISSSTAPWDSSLADPRVQAHSQVGVATHTRTLRVIQGKWRGSVPWPSGTPVTIRLASSGYLIGEALETRVGEVVEDVACAGRITVLTLQVESGGSSVPLGDVLLFPDVTDGEVPERVVHGTSMTSASAPIRVRIDAATTAAPIAIPRGVRFRLEWRPEGAGRSATIPLNRVLQGASEREVVALVLPPR